MEVSVRPYRGAFASDVDDGSRNDTRAINDNSPLAQVSQWVEFPDLDPGESKTESAVFLKQGSSNYGTNSKPEIIYEPEKKK